MDGFFIETGSGDYEYIENGQEQDYINAPNDDYRVIEPDEILDALYKAKG